MSDDHEQEGQGPPGLPVVPPGPMPTQINLAEAVVNGVTNIIIQISRPSGMDVVFLPWNNAKDLNDVLTEKLRGPDPAKAGPKLEVVGGEKKLIVPGR